MERDIDIGSPIHTLTASSIYSIFFWGGVREERGAYNLYSQRQVQFLHLKFCGIRVLNYSVSASTHSNASAEDSASYDADYSYSVLASDSESVSGEGQKQ